MHIRVNKQKKKEAAATCNDIYFSNNEQNEPLKIIIGVYVIFLPINNLTRWFPPEKDFLTNEASENHDMILLMRVLTDKPLR